MKGDSRVNGDHILGLKHAMPCDGWYVGHGFDKLEMIWGGGVIGA